MARVVEPAFPTGRVPGSAAPENSGTQAWPGRMPAPAREPAFNQTPGRSTNKVAVPIERKAFRTRGLKANGS